jgi:hypothetical protein
MAVTVSTSSGDGNTTDNTVEIPLTLAADSTEDPDDPDEPGNGTDPDDGKDRDDNGALPTTGAQIMGLLTLSLLLLLGGAMVLVMARPGRRFTLLDRAIHGPAGSHASTGGIAAASRAARPAGPGRRTPKHAASSPARQRRSGA